MTDKPSITIVNKLYKVLKIGATEIQFDYDLLDKQDLAGQIIGNNGYNDKIQILEGALRINLKQNMVVMKAYELDKNKYIVTPTALNHYMLDIHMNHEELTDCLANLCFE